MRNPSPTRLLIPHSAWEHGEMAQFTWAWGEPDGDSIKSHILTDMRVEKRAR
jgi:hypothetical protein